MVSLETLRDTVTRIETRLGRVSDVEVQKLMLAYRELVPRFRADLEDERDELLARGVALMLVQHVWKR